MSNEMMRELSAEALRKIIYASHNAIDIRLTSTECLALTMWMREEGVDLDKGASG